MACSIMLHLDARVVVRSEPDAGDAEVFTRRFHAALDDRPERAVVGVRHHVEREVAALSDVNRVGTGVCCCGIAAGVSRGGVAAGVSRGGVAAGVSGLGGSGVVGPGRSIVVVIAAASSQHERQSSERCDDLAQSRHWVYSPCMFFLGSWTRRSDGDWASRSNDRMPRYFPAMCP